MHLLTGALYIDEFTCDSPESIFLLSHWHRDHLKGLTQKFRGTICCSRVTATLLGDMYPSISVRIMHVNSIVTVNNLRILVLDANHLPGSLMFYFPTMKTLYTGDYRLNAKMIKELRQRLRAEQVETIFVDGTYHHPSVRFLSEEESVVLFEEFIAHTRGRIAIGVFHIGTCALLARLGIKFRVDESLSENLKKSLYVMFSRFIVERSRFVVVNPHKFKRKRGISVIIPSSLWFSCKGNMRHVGDIVLDAHGNWRLNYTCHSDYWDNLQLGELLSAQKLVAINESRVNLECFKKSF